MHRIPVSWLAAPLAIALAGAALAAPETPPARARDGAEMDAASAPTAEAASGRAHAASTLAETADAPAEAASGPADAARAPAGADNAPGNAAKVSAASAESAAEWSAASSPARTQLVELFSSQGCSSCPAAEKWLGRLTADPGLWRTRVPINFHVDYWDRLGWRDRYATPLHTERQYRYARALGLGSAYTPGFVVDGAEWRGFFERTDLPAPTATRAGVLGAELRDRTIRATFTPARPIDDALEIHAVVLGTGVVDSIGAGENRGRALRQDFIVLGHQTRRAEAVGTAHTATVPLPPVVSATPERWALALWVARAGDPTPIQATGGWLPEALARRAPETAAE